MTTLALEVHDAGLLAVGDSGFLAPASPGYALLDGKDLLLGREAVDRARLRPRRVHHRFWSELDTAPLPRPFAKDLSAADLAHAHLSQVWEAAPEDVDSVILTVPGSFSERQLGLVLGIAQACGMPVAGMVDSAVAAAADGYPGWKILHLDVQLHGAVLTELAQGDGRVERRRIEVSEVGLVALHDAWARRIAALFVHATRFDPLHSAATEQELYRRLPGWIETLCREDAAVLTLPRRRGEHQAEVARADLVDAAEAFYASVLELVRCVKRAGERVTVLLSHRLAGLPHLAVRLVEMRDVDCIVLPEGAAAVGAWRAREAILAPGEEEALPYVLRLPVKGVVLPSPTSSEESDRIPTHVVHDGLAYPIGGELPLPCSIYHHDGQVVVDNTEGLLLNGEAAGARPALAAGDRLRLADDELQLIAVVG